MRKIRPRHRENGRNASLRKSHSRCFESIQMVTGPSLTRLIVMCAPNTPHSTGRSMCIESCAQNSLNIRSAASGGAALLKEGRFPFLVLAYKVNWLTTSNAPRVSWTERFIAPFSSANTRRRRTLPASQSRSSVLSLVSNPTNKSSP